MLATHIDGFTNIAKQMQDHVNRHKAIKKALLDYLLEIAGQHGVTLEHQGQIESVW
jgi:hypothetical protein